MAAVYCMPDIMDGCMLLQSVIAAFSKRPTQPWSASLLCLTLTTSEWKAVFIIATRSISIVALKFSVYDFETSLRLLTGKDLNRNSHIHSFLSVFLFIAYQLLFFVPEVAVQWWVKYFSESRHQPSYRICIRCWQPVIQSLRQWLELTATS